MNRIVVIGASLNGLLVLTNIAKNLPKDFPAPVFVVQHVAAHSPGLLAHILDRAGGLPAVHPRDGDEIRAGKIYVAPPDRHMLVEPGRIRISHGPKENMTRPAIDPLFRSAAAAYGELVIGVVLTGQLDDGTAGIMAIKDRGGVAVVQDPAEATAPSMPQSVLRHVKVDHRCKVDQLAPVLCELAKDPPVVATTPADELMLVENRIAAGVFDVSDWARIEGTGIASGLNCPECGIALYEMHDPRLLRFRCRSGHAFTALSLLSAQSEQRDDLFSGLFGMLLEEASLAQRVAERAEYASDDATRRELQSHAAHLRARAQAVLEWMRSTAGLVEPEPRTR